MTEPAFPSRHALSRAKFFLDLAMQCPLEEREKFEACLEASVIFSRASLHRLETKYKKHSKWKPWWQDLLSNPTVTFFRNERNWILKEAPPKINQVISMGTQPEAAADFYYYELPGIPATTTIEKHLGILENLVLEAESLFGNPEVALKKQTPS